MSTPFPPPLPAAFLPHGHRIGRFRSGGEATLRLSSAAAHEQLSSHLRGDLVVLLYL